MPVKDCYSPLKIFHHRERIDALQRGERPAMLHVQLIPTNHCNQCCSFCAYRSKGYSSSEQFDRKDEIPIAKLLEIVEDCRTLGVQAVEITGGGEPTVHPQFVELCQAIEQNGMQYAIVTNGSRLSQAHLDVMGRAAWVRFSFDAGNAVSYSNIRNVAPEVYHQARNNLRQLIKQKDHATVIGAGFVVTQENWREVVHACQAAKDDGVDNFRISAVFQNDGASYFQSFYQEAVQLCRQAANLANGVFTVFNLFGERLDDLEAKTARAPICDIQHLQTYIGADQIVYRCCVVAYNPIGYLGSLQDRRFVELWNAEETAEKLWTFNAYRCPRCMYNSKNTTIAYAKSQNPQHVNFL